MGAGDLKARAEQVYRNLGSALEDFSGSLPASTLVQVVRLAGRNG